MTAAQLPLVDAVPAYPRWDELVLQRRLDDETLARVERLASQRGISCVVAWEEIKSKEVR
jgi:hypothetical protein